MAHSDGLAKLSNDNIDADDSTRKSTSVINYGNPSGRDILEALLSITSTKVNSA